MKNYPYLFQSQPKDDQVVSYRLKVSKTTIYRWKKTLSSANQGKIASLIPRSTKPEHLKGKIYHNSNSDLIHHPKLFNDKLAECLVSEGYQPQMCITHTGVDKEREA